MTKQRKKLIAILSIVAAIVLIVAVVLAVTLTRSGGGPDQDEDPPHTHNFTAWQTVKEPSCTEAGKESRSCTDGDKTEEREIPAKGHTATAWEYDKSGHYKLCSVCREKYDSGAHTYKNGVCDVCSYAHEDHTFQNGKCDVCGLTLQYSELRYEEVLGADGETVTGYAVVGWADSATDRTRLVIPAEHAGKPVVAIGEMAFYLEEGDETLSVVLLPETVKEIGAYAFYGCSALTSIDLEHVEKVDMAAFYKCTGLESAEMDALIELGQSVFYGSGVRTISFGKSFSTEAEIFTSYNTFPDGLERIEVSAENATYAAEGGILYNKAKTEIVYVPMSIKGKVTVADGVTEIKAVKTHFMNHAYVTSLTIPSSVQTVQNDWVRKPFKGCFALAEVYDLTSVGISTDGDFGLYEDAVIHTALSEMSVVSDPDENGFVWRTDADVLHTYFGREKELTLPDGHGGKAYSVGARAFYGSSIEKVTVPSKVSALGESAFQENAVLCEVTVKEGMGEIGVGAFSGCSALAKISLPKSLKKVGAGAFSGCTALERADYAGTVSEWAAIQFENEFSNVFVNTQKEKLATLYLGDGKPLPEKIAIEGIENVGNYAFYGAPVKELVFGKGVKKVGQDAFSYCTELKTVVIGEDMEYFYHAFKNGLQIETFYYEGTQETWGTLNNGNGGSSAYRNAAVYFYSAGTPSEEQLGQNKNWWHYDNSGEPVKW